MPSFKYLTSSMSLFLIAAHVEAIAGGLKPDIEAQIKAENFKWAEAFAQGDYETIGNLYTSQGQLLPPGGSRVTGARAIADYFKKSKRQGRPDTVSFSNFEFYVAEHAVTEVSNTEIRDFDGRLKSRGRQVLIFRKESGAWKLHRDMWNGDQPVEAIK